jgi:hypothetical protein
MVDTALLEMRWSPYDNGPSGWVLFYNGGHVSGDPKGEETDTVLSWQNDWMFGPAYRCTATLESRNALGLARLSDLSELSDAFGRLTTNDVCNIVTNEVVEYTDWDIWINPAKKIRHDGTSISAEESDLVSFKVVWRINVEEWSEGNQMWQGYPMEYYGDGDETRLEFSEDVIVTRKRITRNALGLARLSDLSELSDTFDKLTTNDVCNIVTNEVVEFTEWVPSPDTYNGYPVTLRMDVSEDYGDYLLFLVGGNVAEAVPIDASASTSAYSSAISVTATRSSATRNTLGLARLSDLAPSVSNIVTKAYVEGLGVGDAKPNEKKVALFVITLNGPGESFTDIELKATTNNFSASAASSDRLVYYCHTSLQKGDYHYSGSGLKMDGVKLFVSSQGPDVREWKKLDALYDAAYPVTTIALLVSVDDCVRTEGEWLDEDNEELTWSYVRTGDFNVETNSAGRQIWRQVMPTRWYRELPEWAK